MGPCKVSGVPCKALGKVPCMGPGLLHGPRRGLWAVRAKTPSGHPSPWQGPCTCTCGSVAWDAIWDAVWDPMRRLRGDGSVNARAGPDRMLRRGISARGCLWDCRKDLCPWGRLWCHVSGPVSQTVSGLASGTVSGPVAGPVSKFSTAAEGRLRDLCNPGDSAFLWLRKPDTALSTRARRRGDVGAPLEIRLWGRIRDRLSGQSTDRRAIRAAGRPDKVHTGKMPFYD